MRQLLTRLAPLGILTALVCRAVGATDRPSVPVLREKLKQILASGYHLTEPPEVRLRELLVRLLSWLGDLLGGLGEIAEIAPLAGLPGWLKPVIAGVLIAALIAIIAHIVVGFRGLLSERRRGRGQAPGEVIRRNPDGVLREAEQAFADGKHTVALGLLYLAVLLRLDRIGLLPHDPARTNRENARALSGVGSEARDAMNALSREVEACIYGGRSAGEATWQRARGWADQLWRAEDAS